MCDHQSGWDDQSYKAVLFLLRTLDKEICQRFKRQPMLSDTTHTCFSFV